jgi:hypothetical protein
LSSETWYKIIFLSLLGLLQACGFTPIYGKNNTSSQPTVQELLSQIEVVDAKGRMGYALTQTLRERLPLAAGVAPRYRLILKIEDDATLAGISTAGVASHKIMLLRCQFQLQDATGKKLLERTVKNNVGLDLAVNNPFMNTVADEEASTKTIRLLAEQIVQHLVTYENHTTTN